MRSASLSDYHHEANKKRTKIHMKLNLNLYFELWFATWQKIHPTSRKTAQSYHGLANNYILPRLGHTDLTELSPQKLHRYFCGLIGGRAPLCSAGVAKNVFKLLRAVLDRATADGYIPSNPCSAALLPPEINAKRRARPHQVPFFTESEQTRLLAACEQDLWGDLIHFAFLSGLPQGELLALCDQDLDLTGHCLTISRKLGRIRTSQPHGSKTALALLPIDPYTIPLTPQMEKILCRQLERVRLLHHVDPRRNPQNIVFSTPDGRPIEANTLRVHLARLEHTAGISPRCFSAIRETAIRRALAQGTAPEEVMKRFHLRDRQAFFRSYTAPEIAPTIGESAPQSASTPLLPSTHKSCQAVTGSDKEEVRS